MTDETTIAGISETVGVADTEPRRLLVALFIGASFLSAFLLFGVQPMATKMVLPVFGGSAAVWNTSVLFFQIALLLGYLYTHIATRNLRPRLQTRVHLVLFALPLLLLPVAVTASPSSGGSLGTVVNLLAGLALGVGAPFLLVSTTGPLLQRWFSWTDHARGSDPYFLYAASNVGSILGLLSYPFLIDRLLDVGEQAFVWTVGYVLLGLTLFVTSMTIRAPAEERTTATLKPALTAPPQDDVAGWRKRGWWLLLSFVPSSLMLGVTTFLTTDIAAVPLLWVLPLAIYLATFVIAFGARTQSAGLIAERLVAPVTILAATASLARATLFLTIPLVLASFGCIAMAVHQRLADRRPHAGELTRYYVYLAVGGMFGGLLNGVLAPVLLPGPFEFAPVLVLASLLVGASLAQDGGTTRTRRFWLRSGAVAGGTLALVAIFGQGTPPLLLLTLIVSIYVAFLLLSPAGRSQLAMVSAVVLLAGPQVGTYISGLVSPDETVSRSFFGSYRVVVSEDTRILVSGTTLHGIEGRTAETTGQPLSYYHAKGPLGDAMDLYRGNPLAHIGGVGLGAGAIAAYGREGQRVTFHEIDPLVEQIAWEQFDYLKDSAATVSVILGDGRLTLAELPGPTYDILVLDAFTSDSIPMHLLTREAFEVYDRVLRPGGILAVHISNRYLDLEPVVTAAANSLGLEARVNDSSTSPAAPYLTRSAWMVVSADPATFHDLETGHWRKPGTREVLWTDARSNLFSVIRRAS